MNKNELAPVHGSLHRPTAIKIMFHHSKGFNAGASRNNKLSHTNSSASTTYLSQTLESALITTLKPSGKISKGRGRMVSPRWPTFDNPDEHTIITTWDEVASPINAASPIKAASPTKSSDGSSYLSSESDEGWYPTEVSPIMPGDFKPDPRWLGATHDERNMAFMRLVPQQRGEARSAVCEIKYLHMQEHFWPALDHHNGHVWGYNDMLGMIDWYRRCFKHPPRGSSPNARLDGIWLSVLMTSPWWDCLHFVHLTHEPRRDENGVPMKNEEGKAIWKRRDPRGDLNLELEFLQVWWDHVARLEVRRFEDGTLVLPMTYEAYKQVKGGDPHKWPASPFLNPALYRDGQAS